MFDKSEYYPSYGQIFHFSYSHEEDWLNIWLNGDSIDYDNTDKLLINDVGPAGSVLTANKR